LTPISVEKGVFSFEVWTMRIVDVIIKKLEGGTLSQEEIAFFLKGYVRDEIADYQAAALLMAVFFRGMDAAETAALTREMMNSGAVYDLSGLNAGFPVDKHSTGGVGDKVSLALAPLAAACGVAVPMVSGRGLGHTGGTLDKLESIPGFDVRMDEAHYRRQLEEIGVVMAGQSDDFVPADKRLYALRDVTGTIESIPLICASIMSKKIASGARALVMDVKAGSGAFMATIDKARALAQGLIGVGNELGRPVHAFITDMSQPLGRMIGNSVEVIEAIDCLKGGGPADLREITLELTAEMLVLAGTAPGRDEALQQCHRALETGAALEKFRELVRAQGGNPAVADDPGILDIAPDTAEFRSDGDGFVAAMDCRGIGNAAMVLGAGRLKTTDPVDHGVGIEMLVRIGDKVSRGDAMARIFHRNGKGLEGCTTRLREAFQLSGKPVAVPPLIHECVK
jgi:pyrimidine-nucleoside phosphorylase